MIEDRTLLIVGAGGSVPYGYPSGAALRSELCKPDIIFKNLQSYGLTYDWVLAKFCQEFKFSELPSIDAFLANRSEEPIQINNGQKSIVKGKPVTYGDIGKQAIASHLITFEKEELPEPKGDHWFQYLWSKLALDTPLDQFDFNQLKIVTFNYDRLLEHYIYKALMATYGLSSEQALGHLDRIGITHVYGSLQSLRERAYGTLPTDIASVANCIKVIPELRGSTNAEFALAKDWITWAHRICFIGFSFDKLNVTRLGFPEHETNTKRIFFTRYKLTVTEVLNYLNDLNRNCLPSNFRGELNWVNNCKLLCEMQTLDYLRSEGVLLPFST